MSRPTRSVVAALGCTLLLAGCTSHITADHAARVPGGLSRVVPGACISGAGETSNHLGDVDVTDEQVVDCARSHIYEVLDVLPIPTSRLPGLRATGRNRRVLEQSLDGEDVKATKGFADYADIACHNAANQAMGIADASVDGRTDRSLYPISRSFGDKVELMEPAHWRTSPSLLCLERFNEGADDPSSARVTGVRGHLARDFLTSDFPTRMRTCLDFTEERGESVVDCREPHLAQGLVTYDATSYLSATEIERQRHRSLDEGLAEDIAAKADRVCAELMHSVGGRWDRANVTPMALPSSKWPQDGGYLPIDCYFLPYTDGPRILPGGDLIRSRPGTVTLVRRPPTGV
jgi:hypothetical protein